MTPARVFELGNARRLAHYFKTHVGNLKIGDVEFFYLDSETPIALRRPKRDKPGGGYDNICDSTTALIRAALETRMCDEHLAVKYTTTAPAFLQDLMPQEHSMQRVINKFTRTFRNNSTWGRAVADETARRIITLVNDAFDYSVGQSRS